MNVRINLGGLKDEKVKSNLSQKLQKISDRIRSAISTRSSKISRVQARLTANAGCSSRIATGHAGRTETPARGRGTERAFDHPRRRNADR